jgi:hypothetical protein
MALCVYVFQYRFGHLKFTSSRPFLCSRFFLLFAAMRRWAGFVPNTLLMNKPKPGTVDGYRPELAAPGAQRFCVFLTGSKRR